MQIATAKMTQIERNKNETKKLYSLYKILFAFIYFSTGKYLQIRFEN